MIEERATVVAVRGERAAVVASGATACGGCSERGGCGTAALARFFGRRRAQTLWVSNPPGATPGDQVVVGLAEGDLLRAAWVAYAPPLGGMLLGALLGEQLGSPGREELAALLSGLTGLAVGIIWGSRLSARRGPQATIVRILGSAAVPQSNGGVLRPEVSLEK